MAAATLIQEIPNESDALIDLMEEVRRFCEEQELPGDAEYAAILAVEEIVNNTIKYGCRDGRRARIRLELAVNEDGLELVLEDDAIPFNPLRDAPEPEALHGGAPTKAGGLGIFLVRSLMDEAAYEAKNGGNRLLLRKSLARKNT
ncbi:MAG: ATP-binding protein [Verrucomicrobiota bacterium]